MAGALAWDIGGAHVKFAVADADGGLAAVGQRACPVWHADGMENLRRLLRELAREHRVDGETRHVAVMTAELVDRFASRAEGVRAILPVLSDAVPGPWAFYTRKGLVDATTAARAPLSVASMNWHATAAYVATRLPCATLVDVGSTTTDIVAVVNGRPACRAYDDAGRLSCGELVYGGIVRTPLMAFGPELDGKPLIAEQFATTADVYRVLGALPAGADLHDACDGAGKTPAESARRIARMFGHDNGAAKPAEWRRVAEAFAARQCGIAKAAYLRVVKRNRLGKDAPLVGAGVGRFVAKRIAEETGRGYVDFAELLECGDRGIEAMGATCATTVGLLHLAFHADERRV